MTNSMLTINARVEVDPAVLRPLVEEQLKLMEVRHKLCLADVAIYQSVTGLASVNRLRTD